MERSTKGLPENGSSAVNPSPDARRRVSECVRRWCIVVEQTIETDRSILTFGARDGAAVVLKVMKYADEEWHAGNVLAAFNGTSAVRVYEHAPGAMLLERLAPATSLVQVVQRDDDEATAILADVILRLRTAAMVSTLPTVGDWGRSFPRYLESGNRGIDESLVADAYRVYSHLCQSQAITSVLHGDLHHENVLHDETRGWVVIDPKGVIGEAAYELGAALRNPCHLGPSFLERRFDRRVDALAGRLGLNRRRAVGWAFSQAVLAAIWAIEDGSPVTSEHVWLRLARALAPKVEV